MLPFALAAQSGIIPGQFILQLNGSPSADQFLSGLQRDYPQQDFSIHALGELLGLYRLEGQAVADGEEWLRILQQYPAVRVAQFNHRLERRLIPSDPSFPLQWGMFNSGGIGLSGADISAPEAWDITTGGKTVRGDTIVIAVIDDGFDLDHEDLWFWRNRLEIAGDGLDNDGNGYIDDVQGWNGTDGTPTLPERLHGTHVCGIAAALGNNGVGVTGVNWNAPILPVYADLEEDDVVAAYAYVHSMRRLYNQSGGSLGAYVVVTNSSFGLDFAQPEDFPIWCAMYDSLGTLGILSPAATINAMLNVDAIGDVPTTCASDFLIAVTNTDVQDELNGAGFGPLNIDLGAPGSGVYSTVPGNNYGYNSGTSMATPHVAGTVALLFAAACPELLDAYAEDPPGIALALRDFLLQGVDTVPDLLDRTVSGGRLNIARSMNRMLDAWCRPNGLEATAMFPAYQLYPNPAWGSIYVERGLASGTASPGQSGGQSGWVIYNTLGVVVRQGNWPLNDPDSRLEVSVQDLPAGMYWFQPEPGMRALPVQVQE